MNRFKPPYNKGIFKMVDLLGLIFNIKSGVIIGFYSHDVLLAEIATAKCRTMTLTIRSTWFLMIDAPVKAMD